MGVFSRKNVHKMYDSAYINRAFCEHPHHSALLRPRKTSIFETEASRSRPAESPSVLFPTLSSFLLGSYFFSSVLPSVLLSSDFNVLRLFHWPAWLLRPRVALGCRKSPAAEYKPADRTDRTKLVSSLHTSFRNFVANRITGILAQRRLCFYCHLLSLLRILQKGAHFLSGSP
jgi:hypothetical protein